MIIVYTNEHIYKIFLKLEFIYTSKRGKNSKNLENLNPIHLSTLNEITLYFSTKWNRIDPKKYFECGFEIFGKNFTFHKFIDEKILKLYIVKDKNEKLKLNSSKDEIFKSVENIIDFMKDYPKNEKYSLFEWYCKQYNGKLHHSVEHYLINKLCPSMFIYFLYKKYIVLSKDEEMLLPNISQQYNDFVRGGGTGQKLLSLLEKVEERIK